MTVKPLSFPSATSNAILTDAEWRAVSGLRAVARVALDRDIVALRSRVQENIDTAQALLDRTSRASLGRKGREDARIAPLAEWMRLQAYPREGIAAIEDGRPGWLRYRADAIAALAVADRAAA